MVVPAQPMGLTLNEWGRALEEMGICRGRDVSAATSACEGSVSSMGQGEVSSSRCTWTVR